MRATTEDMEAARQRVAQALDGIGTAVVVDSRRLGTTLALVAAERCSQDRTWGEQAHTPAEWLAILTEEVGEVAKEVAEGRVRDFDRQAYRAELVQVAAVAAAAVECLDYGSAGGGS